MSGKLTPNHPTPKPAQWLRRSWLVVWSLAGRAPLRQKIIGIVILNMLILGFTIAWWVHRGLGGWLSYLLEEDRVAQAMAAGTRGVFIITGLAALAGLFIAWLMTWILTRPILQITRVAQAVERGSLTPRAPVWAQDEIGELGQAFNAMISSLARSQDQLRESNSELRVRNQELAVLFSLSELANQEFNSTAVLEQGIKEAVRISGAHAGALLLTGDDRAHPQVVAQVNMAPPILQAVIDSVHSLPKRQADVLRASIQFNLKVPGTVQSEMGKKDDRATFWALPVQSVRGLHGYIILDHRPWLVMKKRESTLLAAISSQLGLAIEKARLWQELEHKEAIRSRLLSQVVSAQEEERRRISRELHDDTCQSLSSLLVQLKVLESECGDPKIAHRINNLRSLTLETLQGISRMARDLRPSVLDDLGLVAAIDAFIHQLAENTDTDISINANETGTFRLSHEAETTLYRIVQEGLNNAVRHAAATHIKVDFIRQDDEIIITVEDDGRGFNLDGQLRRNQEALGLIGMSERAELIGGSLSIRSSVGKGTFLTLRLPSAPTEEAGAL